MLTKYVSKDLKLRLFQIARLLYVKMVGVLLKMAYHVEFVMSIVKHVIQVVKEVVQLA